MSDYWMRAKNTVLMQTVHWSSSGAPDWTGSGSMWPPVDLTDIVVEKVVAAEGGVDPNPYQTITRGLNPWEVHPYPDRTDDTFNPTDYHLADSTIGIEAVGGYTETDRDAVLAGAQETITHTSPAVGAP